MFKRRSHERPHARVAGAASVAIVLVLSVSACGGGNSSDAETNAPTTTAISATTLPPGSVKVTLADVSANSMLLTPVPSSAPAGTVTFVVTNSGTQEHEFVVLQTELAAADLPFDEAADKALEEGEGVTPIDEIESIMPGETLELVVDLTAGHYALICNLEGHYRKGMRSDFDAT